MSFGAPVTYRQQRDLYPPTAVCLHHLAVNQNTDQYLCSGKTTDSRISSHYFSMGAINLSLPPADTTRLVSIALLLDTVGSLQQPSVVDTTRFAPTPQHSFQQPSLSGGMNVSWLPLYSTTQGSPQQPLSPPQHSDLDPSGLYYFHPLEGLGASLPPSRRVSFTLGLGTYEDRCVHCGTFDHIGEPCTENNRHFMDAGKQLREGHRDEPAAKRSEPLPMVVSLDKLTEENSRLEKEKGNLQRKCTELSKARFRAEDGVFSTVGWRKRYSMQLRSSKR